MKEKVELEASEYSWWCSKCKETQYTSTYDMTFEDGGTDVVCDECKTEYRAKFID